MMGAAKETKQQFDRTVGELTYFQAAPPRQGPSDKKLPRALLADYVLHFPASLKEGGPVHSSGQ